MIKKKIHNGEDLNRLKGWNAKARVFNSDRSVIASLSTKDAH
ncbi:uncharacterized protein METZ01_LOCUS219773 [marine metagenome]|uniref:Uncharacterized protein n=1 Tax=marine metagenome TaxID=408172 RepID=A0A382FWA4_9ZZZZ